MAIHKILLINILILTKYAISSPLNDSCTVSNYQDVATAVKNCQTVTLKNIVIPEKTTLNLALKDGAKLIFDGHITHVPVDWTGVLIAISGNNVDVSGTSTHLIDGLGPKHWKGANETTATRPRLISLQLHKNSQVKNLHLKNCPGGCFTIHSSDMVMANILIDNKDGYPATAGKKYAKNTDGFDISHSSNLRIKNSIIFNQDDCVAINGGDNLLFDNLWCNGSHGLSFSVWDGDVHDIEFRNSHMEKSVNAIHIKTHPDGSGGTIRNVLYHNVTFKEIDGYAVSIQQNYPKGDPKANVKITNLTLNTIQGTMTGKKSAAVSIICAEGGCSNWHWSDVKITGAHNKNVCEHVPSGVSC